MSETSRVAQKSFLPRLGHWAAELLLVFLGAYAAFWLNNYQEHQQEARRRDQILAALENEITSQLESAKTQGAKQRQIVAEFRRALDAGEMPILRPFSFTTDYSATDAATLLQSGGYQLLSVKTLLALREVESTLRGGLSRITHYQNLSDALIFPNLDQDISFFYDPATKKLRKRFAEYPTVLQSTIDLFDDLEKADTELLAQIRAERQKL
jgi:hypothetical protein